VNFGIPSGVLWLHIVSDAVIAIAYLSIPVMLAILMRRRRDRSYQWVYTLVSVFITLGAMTHVLAIVNVWRPIPLLDGMVKAMTALAAVITAIIMAPLLPKLMRITSPITDTLTSLPNRLLFLDRVALAIARMRRENRELLAILVVDLDDFRQRVNESLGSAAGDQLLVRVAKRLGRMVRAADTVARFGGDEFVVLLERVDGPLYVRGVARRIIAELDRPFPFGELKVDIGARIGIVISDGTEQPEDLVAAADTATRRAKSASRGAIELLDRTLGAAV